MAKHGTLPEFLYQRSCVLSDKPVALTTLPSGQIREEVNDEEIADEFDPSSDEEVEGGQTDGGDSLFQGEIGSSATFLLGARSLFGRVVRFNNRLLSWEMTEPTQ